MPGAGRVLVRADAEGRYQLRAPHPSGGVATRAAAGPIEQLPGREAALQVGEAAVAESESVTGPRFTAGR